MLRSRLAFIYYIEGLVDNHRNYFKLNCSRYAKVTALVFFSSGGSLTTPRNYLVRTPTTKRHGAPRDSPSAPLTSAAIHKMCQPCPSWSPASASYRRRSLFTLIHKTRRLMALEWTSLNASRGQNCSHDQLVEKTRGVSRGMRPSLYIYTYIYICIMLSQIGRASCRERV